MKRSIVLLSLVFCLYPSANQVLAQAYPNSMACWNVLNLNNNTCISTSYVMGAEPDTLISGETYKRIIRFQDSWCFTGDWHPDGEFYVRSDNVGRGYIFLLDSMQEYLTVDNSAQVGDTVHNILMSGIEDVDLLGLGSVVIDSVFSVSVNGVTITRQVIDPLCCVSGSPDLALYIFWQGGMGTSFGPMLLPWAGDGFHEIQCLRIQDTSVYREGPTTGIECDCPFDLILNIGGTAKRPMATAVPNPSTGLFTLSTLQKANSVTVYSPTGQQLFQTNGQAIDLNAYPPGLYHAVVRTAQGVGHVRLREPLRTC